jgi:hypothetical protein
MTTEKTEEAKKVTLTINDGVRFGFGFFLVNMAGFAAIGVVAWLIILVSGSLGLSI